MQPILLAHFVKGCFGREQEAKKSLRFPSEFVQNAGHQADAECSNYQGKCVSFHKILFPKDISTIKPLELCFSTILLLPSPSAFPIFKNICAALRAANPRAAESSVMCAEPALHFWWNKVTRTALP
jgi:hypothetical protein